MGIKLFKQSGASAIKLKNKIKNLFYYKKNRKIRALDEDNLTINQSDKMDIFINALITAGSISLIFLILIFSYQQLLIFLTENLGWSIRTNLSDNPVAFYLYNRSNQLIITLYIISLIVGVTRSIIQTQNAITLEYIRYYISLMAQGNYSLRIPTIEDGEYKTLVDDVNILMDSINKAFEDRSQTEKTKDELMNNIGHDIRTPLTSILGYLSLIRTNESFSKEEIMEFLDIVYNKSKSMEVLINDLFEYTSSQKTTEVMNIQEIPMQAFIEQIAADFALQANEKMIEIITSVEPNNLCVKFDPEKMVRILNNFITNALKYGEGASHIQLIVKALSLAEYNNYSLYPDKIKIKASDKITMWLVIEVRNNGELLNDEELSKIYERSYRADKSRTSKEPGSGLGLSIVRNFVNLHKGITYGVVEGDELVFRVEIPQYEENKSE